MRATPWMVMALLVGCANDEDLDGFNRKDDCDDADPFVYPGAPDAAGDGVDGDCDGTDPAYAWLGDWTITDLDASYSGLQLYQDGTGAGTLSLYEDMTVLATVSGALNPDVVGTDIVITAELAGAASPIEGPDLLTLYAEGEAYGELVHISWDCGVEAEELLCVGELKALEISLEAVAVAVR